MLDGKVNTEALGRDLKLLCSESESLELVTSEPMRAMTGIPLLTRNPKTETMRTSVSADSLLRPAISIA